MKAGKKQQKQSSEEPKFEEKITSIKGLKKTCKKRENNVIATATSNHGYNLKLINFYSDKVLAEVKIDLIFSST